MQTALSGVPREAQPLVSNLTALPGAQPPGPTETAPSATTGIPAPQPTRLDRQHGHLMPVVKLIHAVGQPRHDTDDPKTMHLLERALSTLPHLNASAIIADDAGIHWKTISRTSELVQYVALHSPHAQGTFNFTATAMLKPYGPFFPGAGHNRLHEGSAHAAAAVGSLYHQFLQLGHRAVRVERRHRSVRRGGQ